MDKELLRTTISQALSHIDCDSLSFERIAPDGSTRVFYRAGMQEQAVCLAVLPASHTPFEMKEAKAAFSIGTHLHRCGVSVPQIYGYHKQSGMVLFEDLGNTRLYDLVVEEKTTHGDITALYGDVIKELFVMQFEAIDDFDTDWCCDTRSYDQQLMIGRESQYFEQALVNTFLGKESPKGLTEEFYELARKADEGKMVCFLHRDCQSRNIMVKDGKPYFIDFQGGRTGPPGYDLAALLMDPYAGLSYEMQEQLKNEYLELMKEHPDADGEEFESTFPFLALQRNLQIAGAYAFLYGEKNKVFFKQYISPAMAGLDKRLAQKCFDTFPILRNVVKECLMDAKITGIG